MTGRTQAFESWRRGLSRVGHDETGELDFFARASTNRQRMMSPVLSESGLTVTKQRMPYISKHAISEKTEVRGCCRTNKVRISEAEYYTPPQLHRCQEENTRLTRMSQATFKTQMKFSSSVRAPRCWELKGLTDKRDSAHGLRE